ncbi:MAG: DUF4154 domain-containing protein [Candidatus Wallbacteria bacterium]|nr:DUF4154 domain-containing protein [Candidatus Wallbacteria bacterium]
MVREGDLAILRYAAHSCRVAWLLAVLLAAVLAARAPAADPLSAHEDEIKAAYLYNVAKFVEWPAETLPNPDAPLTIGVLSDEGFARVLEAALVGKRGVAATALRPGGQVEIAGRRYDARPS